jgi:hypothetical protein
VNHLPFQTMIANVFTSDRTDDYIRLVILGLIVFGCSMVVWLLYETKRTRERDAELRAELLAVLDEMRSQHLKDSYINQAIGLHQVVDIAHRSGAPLDAELRGKVHDAINDAFSRYRVVSAALSDPNWKKTGPQRVVGSAFS